MAAQSTLFSMQAEGSQVDTPQGGVLGVRVLAATEQAGLVEIRGNGGNGQ